MVHRRMRHLLQESIRKAREGAAHETKKVVRKCRALVGILIIVNQPGQESRYSKSFWETGEQKRERRKQLGSAPR